MMHGPINTIGLLRNSGAVLISGVLLGASAALAPLGAQQAWTASVETEAETAYKAIYERSLEKPKPGNKAVRRPRGADVPRALGAIVPDVPARKAEASPGEAEGASNPASGTAGANPPKAPQVQASAFADPQIRQPNGTADVLTTQVLSDEPEAAEPKPAPQTTGDQYCSNIANAAADARAAWQKRTLAETEKQVEKRVEELNGKIAEYQKWLARRDEFSRKAQSAITDIYAKMKPDAAAQQLAALDEETAAAVITKLSPKISSALMAEMDAKKAARLTSIIASSSKGPNGKPPAPAQSGGT